MPVRPTSVRPHSDLGDDREASQRRHDRVPGVARPRLLRSTMTKAVRLEYDGPIADHHQRQRREAQRVRRRHGPPALRRARRAEGTPRRPRGDLARRGQVVLVGPRRRRRSAAAGRAHPPRAHEPRPPRASCRSSTSRPRSSSPCTGWSIGASFQRALLCDIRIAAEGARFMLPEVGHGVIPDTGGVGRLFQICGHGVASDIVLTGRPMRRRRGATRTASCRASSPPKSSTPPPGRWPRRSRRRPRSR